MCWPGGAGNPAPSQLRSAPLERSVFVHACVCVCAGFSIVPMCLQRQGISMHAGPVEPVGPVGPWPNQNFD